MQHSPWLDAVRNRVRSFRGAAAGHRRHRRHRRTLRPGRTASPARGRPPGLEPLEARLLMSVDATGLEQELYELVNRMRTDPQAELDILVDDLDPISSPYPRVQDALEFFEVDGQQLDDEWSTLTPVAPLAWNNALGTAARGHSQEMLEHDTQSHQVQGEPPLGERVQNAGYDNYSRVTENIFAFGESPIHSHAAFAIDWGDDGDGDGLQDPPGHRNNIMDDEVREIGIGIIEGSGEDVGPQLVTQDFGARFDQGDPFLLGVVYEDADGDDFYDAGEGLGGVDVSVSDGNGFSESTTTASAGGYQLQVPDGSYEVTFSGGDLVRPVVRQATVGTENVKLDLDPEPGRQLFYNNSSFDGNDPAANAEDDNAIAPGIHPLRPGNAALVSNVSNHPDGITGLMIDLADAGTLSASDFQLTMGNDNSPDDWAAAPDPQSVSVRQGAGVNGSDRVTLTWSPDAIRNTWLRVRVEDNSNTGLSTPEVFYFGNAPGDVGNSETDLQVNATDELRIRSNPRSPLNPAPVTFRYDLDRDGLVDAKDQLLSRVNRTSPLNAVNLIDLSGSSSASSTTASSSSTEASSPASTTATGPDATRPGTTSTAARTSPDGREDGAEPTEEPVDALTLAPGPTAGMKARRPAPMMPPARFDQPAPALADRSVPHPFNGPAQRSLLELIEPDEEEGDDEEAVIRVL